VDQYRLQSRGGKGIKNYDTQKNGHVAGVKVVDEEDDIIIITDDGIIIRIPADQLTVQSRYGGGVRAMRVAEGSRVVTLARSPKENTPDDSDPAEETGESASPEQDEEIKSVCG
jgi:DNA gyrase subunit A